MSSTLPSIEETMRQNEEFLRQMEAANQSRIAREKEQARRKQAEREQTRAEPAYQDQVRRAEIRREQERRAAELAKVKPKAQFGTIYRGRLNESEKTNCDCDGQLTKRNFSVGSCKVESMTVSYKLDILFGDVTVSGNFIWQAPNGAATDCLPSGFKLWIKLQNADSYGYVKLAPTKPKAGKASHNTKSSPNWGEFLCGFNGSNQTNCFDAKTAKTLYKAGRVVGFTPSHQ